MPAYTFKCYNCNKVYEINLSLQEFDSNKQLCEDCNIELKRIFTKDSSTLIQGNGFYQASKVR